MRKEVIAGCWKPGQTCTYRGAWGHVFFILGDGDRAIINFDSMDQLVVPVRELQDPLVRVRGPVATVQYGDLVVEVS